MNFQYLKYNCNNSKIIAGNFTPIPIFWNKTNKK